MTKVLIVDDHKMFGECLQIALAGSDFEIVDLASDGPEAIKSATHHGPQLVLIDVNMPGMQGLEVAIEMRRELPLVQLVFLTGRRDEACIRDAMRLGAQGYISKTESLGDIRLALQRIVKGELYISADLWGPLVAQWLQGGVGDEELLTLRERQVLKLVAEGHSTKDIAALLQISPKTADSHRTRLMAKLGIHEVAGLVRYALRQGIVVA